MVKYSTSVAVCVNDNAPTDTGNTSSNLTSMIGLFLFDKTVSVASENIALSGTALPTLSTGIFLASLGVTEVEFLKKNSNKH